MPEDYECTEVKEVVISGTPALQFSFRKPNSTMHHTIMPDYTIAARAIELDMDPEQDFHEVLNLVLHEGFIIDDDPDDPAAAAGYVTSDAKGRTVAANLFTAETIQDAREAHQLRVAKVRNDKVRMNVPDPIKEWVRDRVVQERRQVAGRSSAERPELAGLHNQVQLLRLATRGREDGRPLKG